MITIDNYDKILTNLLDENRPIQDIIVFTVNDKTLRYSNRGNYLACHGDINRKIFSELGITDRYNFCSLQYGYTPEGGDFPEARVDDNAAITRVTYALFEECRKQQGLIKRINLDNINNISFLPSDIDIASIEPECILSPFEDLQL